MTNVFNRNELSCTIITLQNERGVPATISKKLDRTKSCLVRPEQPVQAFVTGLCAGSVAQSADRIAAITKAQKALR